MSSSLIDRILDHASTTVGRDAPEGGVNIRRGDAPTRDPWGPAVREGELAVDVYQAEGAIVIQAAVAGVTREDIMIEVQNDMVTIRGTRRPPVDVPAANYLYKECFWGPFSRTIVLPCEVDAEAAQATFHQGILSLVLPQFARNSAATAVPIKEIPYE